MEEMTPKGAQFQLIKASSPTFVFVGASFSFFIFFSPHIVIGCGEPCRSLNYLLQRCFFFLCVKGCFGVVRHARVRLLRSIRQTVKDATPTWKKIFFDSEMK